MHNKTPKNPSECWNFSIPTTFLPCKKTPTPTQGTCRYGLMGQSSSIRHPTHGHHVGPHNKAGFKWRKSQSYKAGGPTKKGNDSLNLEEVIVSFEKKLNQSSMFCCENCGRQKNHCCIRILRASSDSWQHRKQNRTSKSEPRIPKDANIPWENVPMMSRNS